ncbi:MAG: FAD-binding protein [Ruminococcaceae bacterium]|nr:FAD-binding protein [Oscillospiraceae bacterium]
MIEQKYPHIFEPIRLGNVLFRNRIFASPTGYQNVPGDNTLPEGAAAYYGRKALGGAASVASCELIVDGELGRGGANHIAIDDHRSYASICRIAHAVSIHGAVATAELQHAGMFANRTPAFLGAKGFGPAYGPVERMVGDRLVPEMPEEIIERTIEKYAQAALTAKRAGFGMVLIHAGHGWLLHQFVSPILNTRKDKWGGAPIENRARFTVEICKAIKRVCGKNFPIEVRISGSECYDGGFGIENGIAFAKQLEEVCDLIHVSAGNHEVDEVFGVTHPSMFLGEGPNVRFAAEIKKHVKTPVATVGAIGEAAMIEEILASGQADVVEMARALLADPDLPVKIRTGREEEIRPCLRCMSCFSTEMTCGEPYCAINPETGRELEMRNALPAPRVKKKVLVVGGGIGGMQAALTCAERGHEVILCEKTGTLGGTIRCEKDVPFKQRLDLYLKRQAAAVQRADIDLRLNTAVTPEYAEAVGADVIIAATGARPVKPPIPGIDGANVLGAEYAYTHTDEVGQSVCILGAGLVGLELGIYLAILGKHVQVVEMAPEINDGGNFLHAIALRTELKKRQVKVDLNTRAMLIRADGVLCQQESGEKFFPADTVIYAVGQRPESDAALALRYCAPEFYQLGDCISPKNITNATGAAFQIACDIGRY